MEIGTVLPSRLLFGGIRREIVGRSVASLFYFCIQNQTSIALGHEDKAEVMGIQSQKSVLHACIESIDRMCS